MRNWGVCVCVLDLKMICVSCDFQWSREKFGDNPRISEKNIKKGLFSLKKKELWPYTKDFLKKVRFKYNIREFNFNCHKGRDKGKESRPYCPVSFISKQKPTTEIGRSRTAVVCRLGKKYLKKEKMCNSSLPSPSIRRLRVKNMWKKLPSIYLLATRIINNLDILFFIWRLKKMWLDLIFFLSLWTFFWLLCGGLVWSKSLKKL